MHLAFTKHADQANEDSASSAGPALNQSGAPVTMRSVAWLGSRGHLPPALQGHLADGFWKRPQYVAGVLVLEHDFLWFLTETGPVLELPIALLQVRWDKLYFGAGFTVTVPLGDAKGQEGKYLFSILYDFQNRGMPVLPASLLPMIAGTPFDDDRPSMITCVPVSKAWKHAFAACGK